MRQFDYKLKTKTLARLGLIALTSDERIEQDFRRLIPRETDLFTARVPSGQDVSPDSLQAMDSVLPEAAARLPGAHPYRVIGYGCTSGTAQIGAARIAAQIRAGADCAHVTEPLSALIAACRALEIRRLAFLSPYVETVSDRLRAALAEAGVETPVFGSFAEGEEARVARIAPDSIADAARVLAREGRADAVFLSCTNLDTLDIIAPLEAELGLPVLSSNLVLAWHICTLAGIELQSDPAMNRLARACLPAKPALT